MVAGMANLNNRLLGRNTTNAFSPFDKMGKMRPFPGPQVETAVTFVPPLEERFKMDHYLNEDGFMVFTEKFHLRRGSCCGSGCRHCPYEPRYQKGAVQVRAETVAQAAPGLRERS